MKPGSILGEIHRRSVWQILGSYAVGAWIVLQLAETLAGLIGLPLWFGPTVIGLVLAGVPLIVVTSLVQGGRNGRSEEEDESPGSADAGVGEEDGPQDGTAPEPGLVGASDPTQSRFLRRTFTWRNLALSALGVALLLFAGTAGYSAMRTMGLGPMGTLQARGVLEAEEQVILANFDNRTDDPALGETVTALFRIDIAQSPSVTVLERSQISGALARMQQDPEAPLTLDVALELAQREGVKAVLAGEVHPLGDGAVLSIRLVTPDSGTLVALRETARTVEAIPDAVDRLSAQLRERIGESLRSIRGEPPLERVTTGSLEALRLYARGVEENERGAIDESVELMERAIEEDSTFAMAHRKLGVFLVNENIQQERSQAAFTRAFELRDRLTEREALLAEAAYFTYVEEDGERAEQAYEEVLERHPNDYIALNNLAVRYSNVGRAEEALELHLRRIRQGGATALTYQNAMILQFELGQDSAANATIAQWEEIFGESLRTRFMRAGLLTSRFQYDEAMAVEQADLENMPPGTFQRLQLLGALTSLYFVQGRISDIRAVIEEVAELGEAQGVQTLPAPLELTDVLLDVIRASIYLQDYQEGAAILDRELRAVDFDTIPPARRAYLSIVPVYALAGRVAEARQWLEAYEAEVPAEVTDAQEATFHEASAEVALAEGRFSDALEHVERARELRPDCDICGLEQEARIRASMGEIDRAIELYERYVDTRVFNRIGVDATTLFDVFEALGSLHAQQGNLEEARSYYGRFLELWDDADPELLPRIERVRAALRNREG